MLNGILTGGSWLVSSTHWTPQVSYEAGLFAMEDSGGWDRGHLVYLPYCSRCCTLYLHLQYLHSGITMSPAAAMPTWGTPRR